MRKQSVGHREPKITHPARGPRTRGFQGRVLASPPGEMCDPSLTRMYYGVKGLENPWFLWLPDGDFFLLHSQTFQVCSSFSTGLGESWSPFIHVSLFPEYSLPGTVLDNRATAWNKTDIVPVVSCCLCSRKGDRKPISKQKHRQVNLKRLSCHEDNKANMRGGGWGGMGWSRKASLRRWLIL